MQFTKKEQEVMAKVFMEAIAEKHALEAHKVEESEAKKYAKLYISRKKQKLIDKIEKGGL